ncbi:MAG: hypothetical protein IT503_10780 [Burkholderiaceae bacterium]|nr:hypothetical protein [Burkholderiaceae bacterium]
MVARWMTFLLWAAVAASAVAWGLRLLVVAPPMPPEARLAGAGGAPRGDLARVLGADAPPPLQAEAAPAPDARFQLVGVVAPRSRKPLREGVALIAVDGKPAKAFRIGAAVDGATVLKSVRARGADLGPVDGGVTIALDIAPPAPASTGTLPPAGAAAAALPPAALPAAPPAATTPRTRGAGRFTPTPLPAPAVAPPSTTPGATPPPPASSGEAALLR